MSLQKTPSNIIESQIKYRRTKKGVIGTLYSGIRKRSRRNGRDNDDFTLDEFRLWIECKSINKLFNGWVHQGFKTYNKPSVDRIDPLKGYVFSNMQLITAKENRDKGDKEKLILWGKPIYQMTMDGNIIKEYPSIKVASEMTKINRSNISYVMKGKRYQAGGFKWKFKNL